MYSIYRLNLADGRKYIGVTNNIKRRLSEHKVNFQIASHDILYEFDDIEDAYAKEREMVNWEVVDDPSYANQTVGGRHPIGRKGDDRTPAQKQALAELIERNSVRVVAMVKSEEHRSRNSEYMKTTNPMFDEAVRDKHMANVPRGADHGMYGKPGTMLGRTLTVAQKEKISYTVKTPLGVFSSSVEASTVHGVTQQTIMNRCYSTKPKWAEYMVVSKGIKYDEV